MVGLAAAGFERREFRAKAVNVAGKPLRNAHIRLGLGMRVVAYDPYVGKERFRELGPAEYFPHCYRPSVHSPRPPGPPRDPQLACDLAFIGTAFASRIRFFEAIGRAAYDAADCIVALYEANRQRQVADGAAPSAAWPVMATVPPSPPLKQSSRA